MQIAGAVSPMQANCGRLRQITPCRTHQNPPRHLTAASRDRQHAQRQPGDSGADACRRWLLQGGLAAAALLVLEAAAGPSRAQVENSSIVEDLERQLPGLPSSSQAADLPKAYQRTMRKLARALQESIEAEAAGAKEFEVRRKADGAKDLVKEFVGKWQDNAAVVGDVTHSEMKDAISELGRFYQSAGPRARLSEATKQSVLGHLEAVLAALPEEEKSLLGF